MTTRGHITSAAFNYRLLTPTSACPPTVFSADGRDNKMTASITPTILSSKSSIGIVPSTQLGNVAWNDDGQCMFLTKKGATVIVSDLDGYSPPAWSSVNVIDAVAGDLVTYSSKFDRPSFTGR